MTGSKVLIHIWWLTQRMCCIPIHPSDVYKMNSMLMFGSLSEFIMLSLYLPCSLKKAMWCGECGWSNELRIEKVWCLACEEEAERSWWITSPHWPSIISPRKQASYARWPLGVGPSFGLPSFCKEWHWWIHDVVPTEKPSSYHQHLSQLCQKCTPSALKWAGGKGVTGL